MPLERANETYKNLLSMASKFVSPSLKRYFLRKAALDHDSLLSGYKTDKSVAERYVKSQEDLTNSLDRMTSIYNTYSDETSTL